MVALGDQAGVARSVSTPRLRQYVNAGRIRLKYGAGFDCVPGDFRADSDLASRVGSPLRSRESTVRRGRRIEFLDGAHPGRGVQPGPAVRRVVASPPVTAARRPIVRTLSAIGVARRGPTRRSFQCRSGRNRIGGLLVTADQEVTLGPPSIRR